MCPTKNEDGNICVEDKLANIEALWPIYHSSFPEMERRNRDVYEALCRNEPKFVPDRIEIKGQAAALLWHWEMPKFTYIEHFAVSKKFRNQGLGSKVLKRFFSKHKRIVLEIEPPENEIQERRLAFYQRHGFVRTGFNYVSAGFGEIAKPHRLELLSYPESLTTAECGYFERFINQRILKHEKVKRTISIVRSNKCRA